MMGVFFELLDTPSGNLINDFGTEREALSALAAVANEHGFEELQDLALIRVEDDHPTLVARDEDLIARVRAENQPLRSQNGQPFFSVERGSSRVSLGLSEYSLIISIKQVGSSIFPQSDVTATKYLDMSCVA